MSRRLLKDGNPSGAYRRIRAPPGGRSEKAAALAEDRGDQRAKLRAVDNSGNNQPAHRDEGSFQRPGAGMLRHLQWGKPSCCLLRSHPRSSRVQRHTHVQAVTEAGSVCRLWQAKISPPPPTKPASR